MSKHDRRVLFLFGAGASYGAGFKSPPPLGKQLYPSLVSAYPSWRAIKNGPLDPKFDDFEVGMESLWLEERNGGLRALWDMAHYFSTFQPKNKDNLYAKLLSFLWNKSIFSKSTFASINYETLFEDVATQLSFPIYLLTSSPQPKRASLFLKPHGSYNWLVPDNFRFNVAKHGDFSYDGPIDTVSKADFAKAYAGRLGFVPAMSLYTRDKHSPIAPNYLDQHRKAWAKSVLSVGTIVIIGARPVEHDEHLWEPLLRASADVMHIGSLYLGDEHDAYARQYEQRLGPRLQVIGDRFAESFDSLLKELIERSAPKSQRKLSR